VAAPAPHRAASPAIGAPGRRLERGSGAGYQLPPPPPPKPPPLEPPPPKPLDPEPPLDEARGWERITLPATSSARPTRDTKCRGSKGPDGWPWYQRGVSL
jgi:hypothetical protein